MKPVGHSRNSAKKYFFSVKLVLGKFKSFARKRAQGAGLNLSPHVNLIESGEHRTGVLSLLQTLSDALPHPVHFLLKGRVGQVLPTWCLWA